MEDNFRWTELRIGKLERLCLVCVENHHRRVSADDHSDRLATAIAIFDERYYGSPDSRILYVSVANLKLILHLTGSQCSFWRVADILVRPC